jgi:hypothetical protein
MNLNPIALFRIYVKWVRQLPKATKTMFMARSALGRSIKISLFGLGLLLPLGSIIWALLYLHGTRAQKRANRPLPASTDLCEYYEELGQPPALLARSDIF